MTHCGQARQGFHKDPALARQGCNSGPAGSDCGTVDHQSGWACQWHANLSGIEPQKSCLSVKNRTRFSAALKENSEHLTTVTFHRQTRPCDYDLKGMYCELIWFFPLLLHNHGGNTKHHLLNRRHRKKNRHHHWCGHYFRHCSHLIHHSVFWIRKIFIRIRILGTVY